MTTPRTIRLLTAPPGTRRVTQLELRLASALTEGALLGLADPASRTAALVSLPTAWAAGRFTLADAGVALARVLEDLRAHGAAYERLQGKCVATDAGSWERLQRAMNARGLRAQLRIVPGPLEVQFDADARMRVRGAGPIEAQGVG
jgi:hypothetical protein